VLSQPRTIFGVHSFAPYSRTDGMFYGILKVLGSSSLAFSGSMVNLMGGSSKYPWSVEEGAINAQLNLKVREYPDFLFQLFGGSTVTEGSADTLGGVSTLTNKNGTSLMHATTGIASVGVKSGSEADLKFGKYVVKVITSTTVQVYLSTDADFGRGTQKTFATDALAIASANFTITSGGGTDLTGFGLTLTGGSGTIGMTVGDTATFEVRPKNTANASFTLGGVSSIFPEFGAIVMAKKQGTGQMCELDLPRVKGEGVPLGFDENKFSEADIKCTVMYDATLDYVARGRFITPTTPN
jgi:hypothetical protein